MPIIPPLPAQGATSWYSHYQALDNTVRNTGVYRRLSDFSGATDDAKLAAFMSYASSQTMRGITLLLDEARDYTFTQQQPLYSGFSIQGMHRPQDQPRSSLPIGNRVRLRMSGGGKRGWFTVPAGTNTFGVSMQNLSIDGDISSYLVQGSSGVLWTSVFRDISSQNSWSVLGDVTTKLLVTACAIDGWWNVNNLRSRGFVLGGSDFYFNPSMMLLDSGPEFMADSEYMWHFSGQSNTWMKNIYQTCDGHAGFLFDGSGQNVWVKDSVFEGRNANTPCPGALFRVGGGQLSVKDCRLAFAMTNPSATGRSDAGVVHQTGGDLTLSGVTYQRATGVAENVPLLYVSAGKARVRDVIANGSWAGKPVVRQATAGLIDADNSVTVVTG